jgi:hypothetical protein
VTAFKVAQARLALNAGDPAAEQSVWRLCERVGAQRFRDSGHVPVEHLLGRFGSVVSWGNAGSPGRQDELGPLAKLADRRRDPGALVRHDTVLDLVFLTLQQLDEQ